MRYFLLGIFAIFSAISFVGISVDKQELGATSVFRIRQGGTSTSTAPIDLQILLGRGDGTYNLSTLTAGTNITLATSTTALTITAASGGGGSNWQFIGVNAVRPTSTVGIIVSASSTFASDFNLNFGLTAATTTLTGLLTAGTINTGQGATEIYLMNQPVQTTNVVTFSDLTITYGGSFATSTITTLTATNLTIGANTLTTSEWAVLDGVTGNVSFWANDAGYISSDFATTTYWTTSSATYWETTQTARTADDLTNNSISDLNDVAAMTEITGDILYYGLSGWDRLASSTLGKVLKIGSTGYPEWGDDATSAGGGSNWQFLNGSSWIRPTTTAIGIVVDNASSTISKLMMVYSTTTETLIIPNSTDPSILTAGSLAINTTAASTSLRFWSDTAETALFDTFEKSFWVASTTDDENNNSFNDATSTFELWNPARRVTLMGLYGKTDTGTLSFACGDGTNWTESIVANSTGVEDDGSMTNNTFTIRESFQCRIGSAATTPSKITITTEWKYAND